MIHKKLTFNINKSLWLFALSFLISITGLHAQNNVWSLPPNYLDVIPNVIVSLPQGIPSSLDYQGQVAEYSHNTMQDKDGNLLFFGVDGTFYDKTGSYLFDLWPINGNRLAGANELLIVPDPADCNSYYIFGDEPVSSASSASVNPNYCKFNLSLGVQSVVVNELMDLVPSPYNTFNRSVHHNYGATKLRADGSRLILLNIARRVYIFKIDNTGISYVKTLSTNFVANSEYINGRNELEVIELNTAQGLIYRVAFAYRSTTMEGWLIFNGDIDYNTLDFVPNTQEYVLLDETSTSVPDQAVPHGLEFSEDGNILYFTHVVNPLNPNPIEYHVIGSGNNVKQALNVSNAADFQFTQIEMDIYNQINFVGEQNNVGNRIAKLTNTNSPSPLNFTDNAVAITYNYALAGTSVTGNPAKKLYNLPDQIDRMDYTAHFNATPECCIIYTSFDVEADKNNQEHTGTATWSPGAGSNPFGSVSGTVTVRDLLVIKSGANITINNMRFEFDVNARLIVENGARLTINGTTLTVYDDCGGDNLMWLGVEVWGTGTGTFQAAVSGRFIAQKSAQNYSIIEHAIEGAVNFKHGTTANNGGIIQATTGTTFKNNYRDVVFNPFQAVFNGNQHNDQSYFSDVTFITDGSLNNPNYNIGITHAVLEDITGVRFIGCDFINTDNTGTIYTYTNRGQGVMSYNSKFNVEARCTNTMVIPCPSFDESNFTNLTEGIIALNWDRSKIALVTKTNFINNFKSIYTYNMEGGKFTENDFDIGASVSTGNFSYGLYLWNCSGYTVENNDFTTTHNGYVGVYVNNSGTNANEIYRNDFSNLVVGSQAANTNGDALGDGDGLVFRCNEYVNIADFDILVSSGLVKDDHGTCVLVTSPANNIFSYTATKDFWVDPSSTGFPTYSYSPSSIYNTAPRGPGVGYNNNNTLISICSYTYDPSSACPDRQSGGRTMMMMSTELDTQEADYDSINDLMSTKDTSLLKVLEQDMTMVKSQMQRTRSYIMQELLLGNENSDGKLEAINFLQQHAAYNTNADEQLLTGLYISTGNIGAAQSKIAQLQSKPNNGQFVEFSNIAITLKQHPKQNKVLLKDSLLLQQVKDLANQPNENSAVAAARALLVNLGLATYEETIEVVIPIGSKARLVSEEETKTTNKDSFVNVFPNPANDNLTISHNLETKNGTVSLEIMDVMGRVLINKTINNTNNQIDINQLSSGLYFYNILQNDKMVQSGKLVVE